MTVIDPLSSFLSGNDLKKVEKAQKLNADCVCLDLEDGVSVTSKVGVFEMLSNS